MKSREKFITRRFRLVGPAQVAHAAEVLARLLPSLPIDAKHPIEVVVQDEPRKRGLDQNGYYWLRIGEVAASAWTDGRQFNSDCWHEYMKRNVMPEIITDKEGVQRSKWAELPDGTLSVISTTELEKGCFANFCTMVEAFGASLGVEFSADPRQRYAP